ncbi:MAG TPA: type II CAAX endopeptidase family protein [Myxococcaceae bacterium]|nr:type II CAAX endopeptidase family protein [Myxococcaceae bacterium]
MTVPEPPPEPPAPRVRPFSDAVTAICTLLLVVGVIVSIVGSLDGGVYFQSFRQPLSVTAQFFDRELELAEVPPSATWARPLVTFLAVPLPEVREMSIRGFQQALEAHRAGRIEATPEEVRLVEGRLALVLGEAGKKELLEDRLRSLAALGPKEAELAAVVRYAYGLSEEPPGPGQLEAVLPLLTDPARPGHSWATDRLAQRTLARLGDAEQARAAEARGQERGSRALVRDLWLYGVLVALVLVGLGVGLLWLVRRQQLPVLSSGVSAGPWSGTEGYAMTVRAIVFSQAGFLCVPYLGAAGLLLGFLLGWVPLMYYLTRRVPAAHGIQLVELFGLRSRAPLRSLVLVTLLLIAVEQALTMGLGLAGRAFGEERWYEGVMEELMRGTPAEVAGLFLTAVVGAPLFEELAFRGLLYTSLRIRFGPWFSAVVSAALFTLLHLYSVLGTLVLFTGAVVSALVYERTRSLLPSIIAHAVNNLWVVCTSLLVYRGA